MIFMENNNEEMVSHVVLTVSKAIPKESFQKSLAIAVHLDYIERILL